MATLSDKNKKCLSDTEEKPTKGAGFFKRAAFFLSLFLSGIVLFLVATVPLSTDKQFLFFGLVFVLALFLRNISGRIITLALVWLSIMVSCRYIYWRYTDSVGFDSTLNAVLGFGLLAAETYTFATLVLGYFQTAWPLNRQKSELPEDTKDWPTVDLFITTYNEPLSVVKPTIIGAMNVVWPKHKIKIHLLDDGRRNEFKEFAENVGINYITRSNNVDSKAGNINHALTKTNGELIAIFDCDHVPVGSFLKEVTGGFLKDKKLALVQTPHHFYSPDPFERNLGTFQKVPNEGELFYGLIQDGNDLWNASFFCGSCAVIRRSALEDVGGIAVESVTEDAFTALRLHRKGYRSAYLSHKQSAGLATESLSAHVGQRVRWARGMAQIFRMDCPLLGRGLTWAQRLCYTNAMLHFFYGLPRIVFLTAPLAFLFFSAEIIQTTAWMLAAYVLPILFISNIVGSRMQGNYRHSFWAEVYETTVSWYAIWPTLVALVNPKFGKFNVTSKGGLVEKSYFDLRIAIPYLVLLLLNVAGLVIGLAKLFWFESTGQEDTLILNLTWTIFNLIILGAVVAVAKEKTQRRSHARVPQNLQAVIRLPEGSHVPCRATDLSEGGGAFELLQACALSENSLINVSFLVDEKDLVLPARVVDVRQDKARISFDNLTQTQEETLTLLIFSRNDAWSHWTDCYDQDRPLASLMEVIRHGLKILLRFMSPMHMIRGVKLAFGQRQGRGLGVAVVVGFVALLALLFTYAPMAAANVSGAKTSAHSEVFSLERMGVGGVLHIEPYQTIPDLKFSVRLDQVVTKAKLFLTYSHIRDLPKETLLLNVSLNNELIKSIPLKRSTASGNELTIKINPFFLSDYNALSFEVVGENDDDCNALVQANPWVRIDGRSTISFEHKHLRLPNELASLPLPFFDPRDQGILALPFAFGEFPEDKLLEAAGAVSAWLGSKAAYRGANFSAYLNELPRGNSLVFASLENKPHWLSLPLVNGPTLAIVNHPRDRYSKLLLVLGRTAEEVELAAHALISQQNQLSGDIEFLNDAALLPLRRAYDANNWLSSERPVYFDGLDDVNFMLAPDLFLWRSKGVPLDLTYRFDPKMTDGARQLEVYFNTTLIDYLPLDDLSVEEGSETNEIERQVKIMLPVERIEFYNKLEFRPDNANKKPSPVCEKILAGIVGQDDFFVDGGLRVDFSQFEHHASLPNLARFANFAFPYSHYADLSETVVVLPPSRNKAAVAAYLTLMGYMGRVTGVPASAVSVTSPAHLENYKNFDLIVLGGVDEQPLVKQWSDYMPLNIANPKTAFSRTNWAKEFAGKWLRTSRWYDRHAVYDILTTQTHGEISALLAFESPLKKGRSVVMVSSLKDGAYLGFLNSLAKPDVVSRIQGDTVLEVEGQLSSYWLGVTYDVGDLPWLTRVHWYFSNHPLLLFAFLLVGIVLLAAQSYSSLKCRAKHRLNVGRT